MKKGIVSVKLVALTVILLFTVQIAECDAQRNATRKLEKETFGQSRRSPARESGESRAAEKAMRQQEKKEVQREREDEKQLRELRSRHLEIQSEETRLRMEGNSKATEEKYKVKRQKQRREQVMPDLKKPDRPGTMNARVKAPGKEPSVRPEQRRIKSGTKDPSKQPVLKQQKSRAKSKMIDPKKQKKLKQHKVKKY